MPRTLLRANSNNRRPPPLPEGKKFWIRASCVKCKIYGIGFISVACYKKVRFYVVLDKH